MVGDIHAETVSAADIRPMRDKTGSLRVRSRLATTHKQRMLLRRAEQHARVGGWVIYHGFKPTAPVKSHVVRTKIERADGRITDLHYTKGYRVRTER